MNNFPAMTEEQRAELVQFNRAIIAQHEAYAVSEAGWPDDVRLLVSSARIALAALTAEPVAYTDAEELETLRKGSFADMFTPHEAYKADPLWMPLFTAPPAPMLRVTEWTNEQCLEFLSIAFRHAEISGDIEMDDIRLGIKMVNTAAPEVE